MPLCLGSDVTWRYCNSGLIFVFFEALYTGIILGLEKNCKGTESFYTIHPTSLNGNTLYNDVYLSGFSRETEPVGDRWEGTDDEGLAHVTMEAARPKPAEPVSQLGFQG